MCVCAMCVGARVGAVVMCVVWCVLKDEGISNDMRQRSMCKWSVGKAWRTTAHE